MKLIRLYQNSATRLFSIVRLILNLGAIWILMFQLFYSAQVSHLMVLDRVPSYLDTLWFLRPFKWYRTTFTWLSKFPDSLAETNLVSSLVHKLPGWPPKVRNAMWRNILEAAACQWRCESCWVGSLTDQLQSWCQHCNFLAQYLANLSSSPFYKPSSRQILSRRTAWCRDRELSIAFSLWNCDMLALHIIDPTFDIQSSAKTWMPRKHIFVTLSSSDNVNEWLHHHISCQSVFCVSWEMRALSRQF